jgi:toxin secretion/phage lysis holin
MFPDLLMQAQPTQPADQWLPILTGWVAKVPMISTLLIMIGIDIVSGLLVAISRKTLNSTLSFQGITKKLFMILLVGLAAVIQFRVNSDLPLAHIVAMFYVVTEAISVLENAAALGVPLPPTFIDVMSKLKDGQKAKIAQKEPGVTTTTTTTTTGSNTDTTTKP